MNKKQKLEAGHAFRFGIEGSIFKMIKNWNGVYICMLHNGEWISGSLVQSLSETGYTINVVGTSEQMTIKYDNLIFE